MAWKMHTVGPPHLRCQTAIKNTGFDPQLAESMDTKPRDTKSQLYIYFKKSAYKWTRAIQNHIVQGSTVYTFIKSLWYTLNLHNVIYQLYLNKTGKIPSA